MLHEAYEKLYAAFGPQNWWPAETPFEMMIGAVLTQNTAWKNVERAVENLREAAALTIPAIHEMHAEELAELIRPAGYYNIKAKRLKNLVRFIVQQYDGDLQQLFARSAQDLREQLLQVNGIGFETADSIVLYAARLPIFVVDAYTARVLKRHGWIEPEADYQAIQALFEYQLPQDVSLFNEYHALIVRVGKEFCGKKPKCQQCPLVDMLPENGLVQLER